MYNEKVENSDEASLLDLVKLLWKNKYIIIGSSIIGGILMFLINFSLPSLYISEASFFHRSDTPMKNGSFGSYSSLLGGLDNGLENQIEEIIKSKSLETILINNVENDFPNYFNKDLLLEEKKGQLNLKKRLKIYKNKRSLFNIEFMSTDPEVSFFVLETILKQINIFNKKLELSKQLKIITVLDAPKIKEMPEYPKKLLNISISTIFFFLLSILCLFIKESKKTKQP